MFINQISVFIENKKAILILNLKFNINIVPFCLYINFGYIEALLVLQSQVLL